MEFLSLKPKAFGLDISDLSLKFLMLRKKGKKFSVVSFGESQIEPGIIEGGEIKDEEKLAKIVKEATKKVKTKYVVACLPEEKAFLQVIKMPIMSEEDLKSAIAFEAENYIPLPVNEVYLDCEVVPPVYNHLKHLDVLLAAIPKNIVDPYLRTLKKAGLKPIAFEIESLAIARALIKDQTTNYSVLIIDLGATRTSFIIFAGKSVRFTTSIPVSGIHFTELIAKNLKVSFKKAEELKIEYGLEEGIKIKFGEKQTFLEKKKGKIFEALVPVLVDLVQQIKKYLDYYQAHAYLSGLPPDGKKVQKIILCGGGANLKGLTEFLNLELKIPVELANPWINIFDQKKEIKGLSFEKSLSFTTAIGLAQRGI
jgi:type IV pilus assembly protein PilM